MLADNVQKTVFLSTPKKPPLSGSLVSFFGFLFSLQVYFTIEEENWIYVDKLKKPHLRSIIAYQKRSYGVKFTCFSFFLFFLLSYLHLKINHITERLNCFLRRLHAKKTSWVRKPIFLDFFYIFVHDEKTSQARNLFFFFYFFSTSSTFRIRYSQSYPNPYISLHSSTESQTHDCVLHSPFVYLSLNWNLTSTILDFSLFFSFFFSLQLYFNTEISQKIYVDSLNCFLW